MISPETEKDILAEISHSLARIANALESFNNAAIRHHNDPNQLPIVFCEVSGGIGVSGNIGTYEP